MPKPHATLSASPQAPHCPPRGQQSLCAGLSGRDPVVFGEIARIRNAQTKVALLIQQGETWALPLFARLAAELTEREADAQMLAQALALAASAQLVQAA